MESVVEEEDDNEIQRARWRWEADKKLTGLLLTVAGWR
jgi:hypothetical protein